MIAVLGPTPYLILAAVLFSTGVVGVLVRRNPLVMFMCVELMLNAVNLTLVAHGVHVAHSHAVNLSLVALARDLNDMGGQIAVFFVLVVAAAEVVVGLGIIVSIFRRRQGATADDLSLLKG